MLTHNFQVSSSIQSTLPSCANEMPNGDFISIKLFTGILTKMSMRDERCTQTCANSFRAKWIVLAYPVELGNTTYKKYTVGYKKEPTCFCR